MSERPRLIRRSRSREMILELHKPTIVLGREDTCDYAFDNDPQLSREHCGFRTYDDGAVTVTDYGSCNGTFVNDERIFQEHPLHTGDVVRLGNHAAFVFDDPNKPAPAESAPEPPKPNKPPPPKSKLEAAAAEIEAELDDRSYSAVMRDLVKKARPRKRRRPVDDRPNEYF